MEKMLFKPKKILKDYFQKNWNKLHLQIIYYGREYCKARDCYGITCKICTTCYPKRKKPVKTKKSLMKILGIGNAIVDVICKVEDNFIIKNNLSKGLMKLIFEEVEFKELLKNLKIEKTISGGSVANSIVGLSQLGNNVGFIGKISDDNFGAKYEEGLKKEKVNFFYSKKKEVLPTGTCLILVTLTRKEQCVHI